MRPRHLITASAAITASAIIGAFSAFSAYAGPVTCRWTAETSKPAAQVIDAFQGETIHIEPTLVSYGAAVAVTTSTLTIFWQTNGMASSWWSKAAAADSSVTGRVRAVFAPTNDIGAAQYIFYIQSTDSSASNFRAYGLIRMRSSPGYAPTAAPAPGYQWVSPSDLQAVSNALASANQALASASELAIAAATNPIPAAIAAATNPVPSWITAATNAIPRVPTNAVTGWLLYDAGSNKWLRVSVSNYSYYISEVL